MSRTDPSRDATAKGPIRDESAQVAVVRMLEQSLPAPVERIDTHISRLFLTPDRAFKLKRARALPYVDFTDPARRLDCCAADVTLNGPHAPGLYLGTRDITREADGSLTLDGKGEVVDRLVEMRRFPADALLSELAAAGRLTPLILDQTADAVVALHRAAPRMPGGGARAMAGVLDINEAGFATGRVLDKGQIVRLNARFRAALDRHATTLDARAGQGLHRRCHGDLHLRNMVMWRGRPCPFDAIEFNEALASCDTGYDTAFLLMDLWQAGRHAEANRVANRIADADDEEGFPLLPFFMAVRAAVRAHIAATRASEDRADAATREAQTETAERYMELAETLLDEVPPRLVALGGYSGSGKTTLARAVAPLFAPPPGARVIESDPTRKALFGVAPEAPLPPEAYESDVSAQVHDTMAGRAAALVASGCPVIITAVHRIAADRAGIATAAGAARFDGVALTAPAAVLRQRVAERPRGASDATLSVLNHQLSGGASAEGATTGDGWPALDVSGDREATVARLAARLGLSPAPCPRSGSHGNH